MAQKGQINQKIEAFYNDVSEEERLNTGLGKLEFARNKELIKKFIPSDKSTIIDVGGGTGKYSEWLAQKGHKVTLVDPVSKHIQQAQNRATQSQHPFTVQLGEARDLNLPDEMADLIILHGPLYHLQEKSDRIKAIKESKRVLKPGGMLLGFAINYTASLFVGLMQGFIHNEHFFEMCKEELTTGLHHPPENIPGLFTEAYYHKPEELKEEFQEADVEYINIFAVEGAAWLDSEYFVSMADQAKKNRLFELLQLTETDKNLLAVSPHMMIASRKRLTNN